MSRTISAASTVALSMVMLTLGFVSSTKTAYADSQPAPVTGCGGCGYLGCNTNTTQRVCYSTDPEESSPYCDGSGCSTCNCQSNWARGYDYEPFNCYCDY